jgi:hypothetical protein
MQLAEGLIGVDLQKPVDELMYAQHLDYLYRSILRCFWPTAETPESHSGRFWDVVEIGGGEFPQFARRHRSFELSGRALRQLRLRL